MLATAHGRKSVPFNTFNAVAKMLLKPASQAEGAIVGLTVILPEIPSGAGLEVLLWQTTGSITAGGSMLGKLQESSDNVTFTDVDTLSAQGADTIQSKVMRVTKRYLKYLGTVSGTGGTIITAAGIVY